MRRWFFVLFLSFVSFGFFANCTNTSKGISPDPTQLHYPLGIAIHPSGKYIYVSNANFDLAFSGGTVMALDTKEDKTGTFDIDGIKTELKTLRLLKESTMQIGSFAGQLVINNAGTRLYTAVRQDKKFNSPIDVSSITILDVDISRSDKGHLSCKEKAISKDDTGGVGEEGSFEHTPPPRCGDDAKIFLEDNPFPYNLMLLHQCTPKRTCQNDSTCQCSAADKTAGICKTDQACHQSQCVDVCQTDKDCGTQAFCKSGKCQRNDTSNLPLCKTSADCTGWEKCKEDRLLATHLQTGGISEITIQSKVRRITGITSLPSGVTAMAVLFGQTPLGGFGEIFLTSRQDSYLYLLPPQLSPANTDQLKKIQIPHASTTVKASTIADLRGIALGYDKKNNRIRLYVAVRSPSPAVLVYHLERVENQIRPQLIASIPVGSDPSQIVYNPRPSPEPDQLYVICSGEGRVDVIDVESYQVVHQIKVGLQPYFMAIYEPTKNAEIKHRRAYVANFLSTTISIINLDNHQVIGMVSGIDTRPPLP